MVTQPPPKPPTRWKYSDPLSLLTAVANDMDLQGTIVIAKIGVGDPNQARYELAWSGISDADLALAQVLLLSTIQKRLQQ